MRLAVRGYEQWTLVTINARSDRAVYLQVADIVRNDIVQGRLKPGADLPSEANLGQTLGVGREAIRQGLGVLRAEGLITTARGFGSRVRERPVRQPLKLKRGDVVTARMPSEPERRKMDLDEGVPLLILTHADGKVEVIDSDVIELTA
jgi:DNA-binding transcriptional regulator YhcF (GntR family)